jgi:hypothetical protein
MDERDKEDLQHGRTIWRELKEAGLFSIGTPMIVVVLIYLVAIVVSLVFTRWTISDLGQFGDTFGALTSLLNALAFAAVVATVVLQSRELKESRKEMVKQATAQQAWADAAARQIELTKQLESVRIRPYIKAELHGEVDHATASASLSFWVQNVGLGVAIVQRVELKWEPNRCESFTTHSYRGTADDGWSDYVSSIVGHDKAKYTKTTLRQFDDHNRIIAPGEKQELAQVYIKALNKGETEVMRSALMQSLRPNIYFQSVDGSEFSVLDQFEQHV